MESSYEIHSSLASYANVLHSHVLKTDEHIASLKTNLTSFAQAQGIANLSTEESSESLITEDTDAEEAVVAALESERLRLIMDIQEQDFAQKKLKEMIKESSELIHAVSQFYKDLLANRSYDVAPVSRDEENYASAVALETETLIRANISEHRSVLTRLHDSIKQLALKTQVEFLDSEDAQRKLHLLIDSLNEGFCLLLGK